MEEKQQTQTMKQKLRDLLVAISWADLSRTYFGKSNSWLYHKMDGVDGNGKPTQFTEEELETLKFALKDLSNRISTAADSLWLDPSVVGKQECVRHERQNGKRFASRDAFCGRLVLLFFFYSKALPLS